MSQLNRRQFLGAGAIALAGLGACGTETPPKTRPTPPTAAATPSKGAIDDLRRRLKGTVLAPGDAGFAEAGQPANGRYRATRPAVIAQCADEDDVVTCVRWSTENGVPLVARGGGEAPARRSMCSRAASTSARSPSWMIWYDPCWRPQARPPQRSSSRCRSGTCRRSGSARNPSSTASVISPATPGDPVPDSAVAKLIDLLADCPSRTATSNGSMWSLGWVGGAVVNAIGRTDTAYAYRGMSTLLRPTPEWDDDAPASVGEDLLAWTDDMVAVIAPHTPDESYQNFPNRRLKNWPQEYYAENLRRLVEVKTTYDKNNLFRNPQSITPS